MKNWLIKLLGGYTKQEVDLKLSYYVSLTNNLNSHLAQAVKEARHKDKILKAIPHKLKYLRLSNSLYDKILKTIKVQHDK